MTKPKPLALTGSMKVCGEYDLKECLLSTSGSGPKLNRLEPSIYASVEMTYVDAKTKRQEVLFCRRDVGHLSIGAINHWITSAVKHRFHQKADLLYQFYRTDPPRVRPTDFTLHIRYMYGKAPHQTEHEAAEEEQEESVVSYVIHPHGFTEHADTLTMLDKRFSLKNQKKRY